MFQTQCLKHLRKGEMRQDHGMIRFSNQHSLSFAQDCHALRAVTLYSLAFSRLWRSEPASCLPFKSFYGKLCGDWTCSESNCNNLLRSFYQRYMHTAWYRSIVAWSLNLDTAACLTPWHSRALRSFTWQALQSLVVFSFFTESLATVDLLVNFKKQTAELQYLRLSSHHLVDGLFWGAQIAPIPKVNVTTNSLVEESKSSAACFAAFFSMRMDWQVFQIL